MKTLYLLRHGTAESHSPQGDFYRNLVDQGRAEAEAQGRIFRQGGLNVERIFCSTAQRAQETAHLFAQGSGLDVPIEADARIYEGTGEGLLTCIQEWPDDAQAILLVGHMPGVGHLLSMVATEHVDLSMRYAPATLAGVHLDADTWDEADYGVGTLVLHLPPVLG